MANDVLTAPVPFRVHRALTAIDCALDSLRVATDELDRLDPRHAPSRCPGCGHIYNPREQDVMEAADDA